MRFPGKVFARRMQVRFSSKIFVLFGWLSYSEDEDFKDLICHLLTDGTDQEIEEDAFNQMIEMLHQSEIENLEPQGR